MNREYWIDIAKGIGIVLVVYGHVARGLFNAEIPVNYDLYKCIDDLIYKFHMPLFFLFLGIYTSLLFRKKARSTSLKIRLERFYTCMFFGLYYMDLLKF